MNEVKAWHFLNSNRRLNYGDDRLVIAGETLSVDPPVEICEWGMHASRRVIDALPFATSPLISRVTLFGNIQHGWDGNKSVATSRKTLWILDCTKALRSFSRWAVAIALTEAKVTDKRSWDAITANELWHADKLTYEELEKTKKRALRAVNASAIGERQAMQQIATKMATRLVSEIDTLHYTHTASGSACHTAQHMSTQLHILHINYKGTNNLPRQANITLTREIMKQYRQEHKPNARTH